MADRQLNVNTPPPPNYAGFGADAEALAANHNKPMPSGWSLAGPLLFLAVLVAVYILHQVGVW